MKVTAIFHGVISDWVGVERADFDLGESAIFADLLLEISESFRHRMPEQLWNEEQNAFVKSVEAFSENKRINELDSPMADGQEIKFFLMMAGG